MKTVYHPTIPGIFNEIEDDTLEAWLAQGWLKTEPKASKDARAAAEPE